MARSPSRNATACWTHWTRWSGTAYSRPAARCRVTSATEVVQQLDPGVADELWELLLPGVREMFEQGFESSLHGANLEFVYGELDTDAKAEGLLGKALYDPQTSGGLLVSVAPGEAAVMLRALREAGYSEAALIGTVEALPDSAGKLRLLA